MISHYHGEVEKFICGVPDGLEIVNLGSTFSKCGFDYKYFGKKGFNFAVQPQPLTYDYKIFKQYADKIKKGSVVVVVVCPFGFSVDYYPNDDANWKYYFFLDKNEIRGYSKSKEFAIKHFPLLMKFTPLKLAKKVVNKALGVCGFNCKHTDRRIASWMNEFDLSNVTDGKQAAKLSGVFENTVASLKKILKLCKEHEFRPVIINMPAVKEQHGQFSEEFIESFYTRNLKHANVYSAPVIDYFRDERFDDASLYENGVDCLNDKGREYFAKIFIEDLKKLGLWED